MFQSSVSFDTSIMWGRVIQHTNAAMHRCAVRLDAAIGLQAAILQMVIGTGAPGAVRPVNAGEWLFLDGLAHGVFLFHGLQLAHSTPPGNQPATAIATMTAATAMLKASTNLSATGIFSLGSEIGPLAYGPNASFIVRGNLRVCIASPWLVEDRRALT
jgi:hypothetical protein